MLHLKFIAQFLNSGIPRSCHTIVMQSLNIHQVVQGLLFSSPCVVIGQFFGIHQVIRQVLNCHHVGFKSVKVVIFSPFFENTRIFSLVICCIFLYFIRPQVINLLPVWVKKGTCEEDPEVPSPISEMRACLLHDPSLDKMDRMPALVDIRCEAYEICMPLRPDDSSTCLG